LRGVRTRDRAVPLGERGATGLEDEVEGRRLRGEDGPLIQGDEAAIEELARWCAQGKLSCHIQETYPLAKTPEAIKALAGRKVMGKLIVHPGE